MVRRDRSVDVFVRKLRQKLEKASPRWRYIHTHFGIGYRFAAEALDADLAPCEAQASAGQDWQTGDEGKLARAHEGRELAADAR
jgi:DNA-binding winged helix-turn-helix (wHTH) protein